MKGCGGVGIISFPRMSIVFVSCLFDVGVGSSMVDS
tara:strand:+ start:478 stop:585 length:108 start_codon:yes stop_codon:yes gene_type:complete